MDILFLEVVLWAALFFFFWALKDNLGHVENDIEKYRLLQVGPGAREVSFAHADSTHELIGTYDSTPIFEYAVIGNRRYRFDRVSPDGMHTRLRDNERCLAPGLVYIEVPSKEG